ncbi:HD domain-containing protein [Planctobacterium marinum]|uniref:Phosphohydrolase n=1 Tax=Planctobacterium marinum TaxID=1631968 RepID=A0AA48HHE2_9ALTE|nr:phosphohydrolase [Planctobacterium marinum]
MDSLNEQLNFILELDKLKAVYRQALVKTDNNRQENSAEHSWHIAMLAPILLEHVCEDVNLLRVIKMLLIHDIVEIDAGDTFAFSKQSDLDAQHDKELAAANRIFGLLPESQFHEYRSLWLEFEAAESADARFAKAMDRILPLLQNMQNDGGSWAKHGVKKSQVLKRNQYLEGIAPGIWQYVCEQIDLAVTKGWLKDQ